jgi:fatty acid desaturase
VRKDDLFSDSGSDHESARAEVNSEARPPNAGDAAPPAPGVFGWLPAGANDNGGTAANDNGRAQPGDGSAPPVGETLGDVRLAHDRLAPAGLSVVIEATRRVSLPRSVATIAGDHALILVGGAAGWTTLAAAADAGTLSAWIAAAAANAVALALIARGMRGLENLVHEGAHHNFTRHKALNDRLTILMAALPMFQSLERFRGGHQVHHQRLGQRADGDRARNERYRMDQLDRTSARAFTSLMRGEMGRYTRAWLREMGSDARTLAAALGLHAGGMSALALMTGLGAGQTLLAWALYWLVPFFFVLPWLRFAAEAAEHRYPGARTIGEATVSNLGWLHRWLLHPHGDGYHTLHHLWPAIPHHQLARAHRLLLAADPHGYATCLWIRWRVLQGAPERLAGKSGPDFT